MLQARSLKIICTVLFGLFVLCGLVQEGYAADAAHGASCAGQPDGRNACNVNGCFVCTSGAWVDQPLYFGASAATCDASHEGLVFWSHADLTLEMCDGANWKKIIAQAGSGAPPNPPAGNGYFVLTSGTWNGDLKTAGGKGNGILGADALCLTDLTNNDWLGKTDASNNGQLNAAHVFSFGVGGGSCNTINPSTTYYFAVSGDNTKGGASFTTDASSLGPNNTQNWVGTNYFDGTKAYWSSKTVGSASLWAASCTSGNSVTCTSFTVSSGAGTGSYGTSNNASTGRWSTATDTCDQVKHLICMVHPP